MSIERSRRLRREQETEARMKLTPDPVSGAPMQSQERTMQEILGDAKEHELFLLYVHSQDPHKGEALIKTYTDDAAMTDAGRAQVETWRTEFNARRAEYVRIRETFTAEYIEGVARMDPRIQQIVGAVGPAETARLLSQQLEPLAVSDNAAFRRLLAPMQAEYKIRNGKRAEAVEERAARLRGKYRISDDEYDKAVKDSMGLRYGVTDKTQKALEQLAADRLGKFGKVMNFLSIGSVQKFRAWRMKGGLQEEKELLRECDIHLEHTAHALHILLTPEFKANVQKATLEGGPVKRSPETNVNTIHDVKRLKDQFEHPAIVKRLGSRIEAECLKLRGQPLPSAVSATVKDRIKKKLVDEEFKLHEDARKKHDKPRGFLASFISLFFRTKADITNEIDALWP